METLVKAYNEAYDGINIKENEQIVLAYKNAHYSFNFALNIAIVDIESHEKVILESENPNYCYAFAVEIPGANVKALQDVLIKLKHATYCFALALHSDKADKQALSQAVLESLNINVIVKFYNEIDFDKTEYEKYLMFM